MFSCEICEIFKNIFFYTAPRLLSDSNNLFKDFLAVSLSQQISGHLLPSQW